MEKLIKRKQESFDGICCILKALALFFCFYPLFGVFFTYTPRESLSEISLESLGISLGLLLLVLAIWLILQRKKAVSTWQKWLEIVVFYGICMSSILSSGANESDYKFMFIFMVVTYTLQYGTAYGIAISIIASATLIGMDLAYGTAAANSQIFQSDLALSIMFGILAFILGQYVRLETEHINKLTYLASYDGLTQLYNHRYFHDAMEEQWRLISAEHRRAALIMMDIDYFKQYNDFCGHQEGDRVLQSIASLIRANTPQGSIACRYGGEEFAIILPETSLEDAMETAEKVRRCIAETNFKGAQYLPNGHLTLSSGVSVMTDEDSSHNEVISRADMALYRAKYLRKNRVESYRNVFDQFENLNDKVRDALLSIKGLIGIVNMRDDYTYSHTERVVYCCEVVADYMKLDEESRRTLLISAYMHDIGKVNIPREVLITSERFTDEQWEMIKNHPTAGRNIISKIEGMDMIGRIIEQHHERYDGHGYPFGLKGDEIHPLASILTLADSFDAMTNDRPYKKKKTISEALQEIRRCEGTQFDPEKAEIFIAAIQSATSLDERLYESGSLTI